MVYVELIFGKKREEVERALGAILKRSGIFEKIQTGKHCFYIILIAKFENKNTNFIFDFQMVSSGGFQHSVKKKAFFLL